MISFFLLYVVKSVPLCVDLGAENMRATQLTRSGALLVHTADGRKFTPAVASLMPNSPDAPLIFTDADVDLYDRAIGNLNHLLRYPKNCSRFIPQLLGKNFTKKITGYFKVRNITLPLDEDEDNYLEVLQPPEFFAAELLGKAIDDVKRTKVNLTVDQLTVIVPKFYTHHQRIAMIRSGKLATHKPVLLDTPTAVSHMFATERNKVFAQKPQVIMFVDIGASQIQVWIDEFISEKNATIVNELGYGWVDGVGGQAIDSVIGRLIRKQLEKLQPDADINYRVVELIMASAKKLKHLLTLQDEVNQTLEDLIPGFDFSFKITKEELKKNAKKELNALKRAINQAIKSSLISPEDLARVELVGGASRIPLYVDLINETLNGTVPLHRTMNPEEAAITGAAYYVASMKKNYLEKPIIFKPCKIYNIAKKNIGENKYAFFYKEKDLPIGINQFILAADMQTDGTAELVNGVLKLSGAKKLTKSGLHRQKRFRTEALLTAFEKKEKEIAETNARIHELESYVIEVKDKLTKDAYIYKVSNQVERNRAMRAIASVQHKMQNEVVTDEKELKQMKKDLEAACGEIIKRAEDAREMPNEIQKLKSLIEEVSNAVLDEFEEQGYMLPENIERDLGKVMSKTEETLKKAEAGEPDISADDVRLALEKLRREYESAKKNLVPMNKEL